jgi:hypothetical protein
MALARLALNKKLAQKNDPRIVEIPRKVTEEKDLLRRDRQN